MPKSPIAVARVTRSSARVAASVSKAKIMPEAKPEKLVGDSPEDGDLEGGPGPRKKRKTTTTTNTKKAEVGVADTAAAETKSAKPEMESAKPRPKAKPKGAHLTSSPPPPALHLPTAVTHLSGIDARFAPLCARIPCRPFVAVPTAIDPFRTLATSIIGQQVSWLAARSITRRFVEFFCGESLGERYDENASFPSREQVARAQVADLKGVGCSTRKAEYLIELAQHFTTGRLSDSLLLTGSDQAVADALIAVRGIGRWTVDMFLIFTLRRPDVLPVGDLGVQKGLLRWVLAAHGALPPSMPKSPRTPKKRNGSGNGEKETHTPTDYGASGTSASATATPLTPTPSLSTATLVGNESPSPFVLVTPTKLSSGSLLPSTPAPPPLTPSASTNPTLPPSAPDSILSTPAGWDSAAAHRAAPLPDGLSISVLKQRLAGKKAKGGVYLLPEEMEALTEAWRPYRSVGTYYTWSMAGET